MPEVDTFSKYGPWAVVTGASEGIGREFALRLARTGIKIVAIARRDGPLAALAREIEEMGGECVTGSIDLTAPDAADEIFRIADGREVGLLVANAGADTNGMMFLDQDVLAWNRLVSMNVMTTMQLAHKFGQGMRERRRGGMILAGSHAGFGGIGGLSVYCGAKAFVLAFAEGLWSEMRRDDADVLALAIGVTDTPAHRKLLEEKAQPLPPDMATPEEVVDLGLSQLAHGPICTFGVASRDRIGALPSGDERRERILVMEEVAAAYSTNRNA